MTRVAWTLQAKMTALQTLETATWVVLLVLYPSACHMPEHDTGRARGLSDIHFPFLRVM